MSLCAEVEAELMAHAAGELELLRSARVEAHVAHCARCRRTEAALHRDLEAARAWDPSLDPAELERLTRRAVGALPRSRGRAPLVVGALAMAAAASVVMVLARRAAPSEETAVTSPLPAASASGPGHGPAVLPVSGSMSLATAPSSDLPARATQWGAGVRAVTSDDWTGRLSRRAGVVELEAARGFAVITVEPGHAPLVLRAPDVVVETSEGRVFVEVLPGHPTRVQLLSGRAELVRNGRREVLVAVPGAPSEAPTPALLDVRAAAAGKSASAREVAAPRSPRDAARTARAPVVRDPTPTEAASMTAPAVARAVHPSAEALARVLEAEALIERGQPAEAERVLAEGARVVEGARAQALLRWEHARLVAQDPARRPEALRLLQALIAPGHGEPAVQAAALRCQLMLTHARPEACLDGLQPGSAAAEEARRVLRRSQLMKEPSGS
jgi:hypothetical protein